MLMYGVMTMVLAFGISAPTIKVPPPKEAPSVLGQWQAVEAIIDGKTEKPSQQGTLLHFNTDNTFSIVDGQTKVEEGTFRVDFSKTPFEIDLMSPAENKAKPLLGILRFEDDKLIICLAWGENSRPTQFETGPKNQMLMTYKREQAK